ncbi:hypothetical protein ACNSO7_26145 [Yersinia enterocolitica]|uniref:hypothetical protein n=1 Tax=Yersinia enterocolitica TaxID=630 RepID=UPI003AB14706
MSDAFYWTEMILNSGKWYVWALIIIIVIVLFKNPIHSLFDRINSLKVGMLEFAFNIKLADVIINISDDYLDESKNLPKEVKRQFDQSNILAVKNPEAAVLIAWRELELTAITVAYKCGVSLIGETLKRASGIAAMTALSNDFLTEKDKENYEKIGDLVKLIRIGRKVTVSDAKEFINVAKSLAGYITNKAIITS